MRLRTYFTRLALHFILDRGHAGTAGFCIGKLWLRPSFERMTGGWYLQGLGFTVWADAYSAPQTVAERGTW